MPVLSNHLAAETRFRTPAVLAEHGIHRAINVIIEGEEPGGLPYGVLEADSSDRDQFSRHDIAFLQSLSNVLSAALVRQRHEAAQRTLLREKDILMQEVHHRIKNNLQLVNTMLALQARSLPDGSERASLNEAAARIMSIAALHRRLHEEGAVESVDLGPYLTGLVADLGGSLGVGDGTRPIRLDVEPMVLPPEHVTPLGLIAVELVTNAQKYGAGPIAVRLRRSTRGVEMMVDDEGPGFPPGADAGFQASLGMRLIAALARTPNPVNVERQGERTRVTVQVAFAPRVRHSEPALVTRPG